MTSRWCERCERVTTDGHLWCQETDCPAEAGFPVFDYGDFLGDLKVTSLLRVWRTSAIYEAERGDEKVLLKVAHDNPSSEERLRLALKDVPAGALRLGHGTAPSAPTIQKCG